MRIVLLGPPGTGKGSLASLCAEHLRIAHISTGEIFRQEITQKTKLGIRVKRYVSSGRLAPDSLVVQVMRSRLTDSGFRRGFVLDGFPRTKGQAAGLDKVLQGQQEPLDGAVCIDSPESILVRRLTGRRVCERCGTNYHIKTMRPKRAGICDRCEGKLVTRKDDQPSTIAKRLKIDREEAKPLLAYYRKKRTLNILDGRGHIKTVYHRALRLFKKQGWIDN